MICSNRLSLKIVQVGDLDSLAFGDAAEFDSELSDDWVEVHVEACGVSGRDVAVATGGVRDHNLGEECAGIVAATGKNASKAFPIGSRVCVWRPGQGAFMLRVRSPAKACHLLPSDMTFQSAAVFSIASTAAVYALNHLARLQRGETLLIHSAAGSVGQKAIQIAQSIGARIFATCSSSNRNMLKEQFGLEDSQIFSSQDDSFVEGVMVATGRRGVDVVLNSLSGGLLRKTWNCVAPFGRFVQIGRKE